MGDVTTSMQSHFSTQTLAEIFRDLYLGEKTAVLRLTREDERLDIVFDRGLIVFAEGNAAGDLGKRLVQSGRISQGALEEALADGEDAATLARALLNRGLVSKPPLQETVDEVVADAVRAVFSWEGGGAEVRDREPEELPFDSDVLTTFEVILQGIFSMRDFDTIRDAMLGLDNTLRLRRPAPIPLERMTLSPAHGYILSRVDGSTTVRDVLSILPQNEEIKAARFIFGLLVMGVLEYDPPLGEGPFRVGNILRDHADRRALERMQEQTIQQAYNQMRAQNPHEVLGVTAAASRQAVERAYEEAKALFSRDRVLPRVRDKFRSELAVIESRLIEAYLRLTQPDRAEAAPRAETLRDAPTGADDLLVRVEMDKTRSKLASEENSRVAEGYFNKARKAVRDGDYHNAIQYGKLAISYKQDDARYYYMLADCQARNPEARWQHQAEQNYTRATELDPWNAEYWVSLGRFYKKRGLALRARKNFEEALKLSPDHAVAVKELKALR